MRSASLLTAALLALSNVLATSPATNKRWNDTPGFVYAENGKYKINGKDFFFAGTTAYWLTQVQINDDICKTLDDIAADDFDVVRIWGFREVVGETNDDPATFTQQWVNGEQKCNQAGLDRIKYILDQAEQRGLFVQLVLTNNWSPDFSHKDNAKFPPGALSNSYGGIDTYVQQVHPGGDHDLFFTDDAVKGAFQKFLGDIVPQFASHKALFAWELANDVRCQGAEGRTTSGNCNTHTITSWTADTAKHIKNLDPNHMVASGDGGFFCTDCDKLFAPASDGHKGKRSEGRTGVLTTAMVREKLKAREKAAKRMIRRGAPASSFKRDNYSWDYNKPAFDGSKGVDTEDILNIPYVDFATFQYFPDQFQYGDGNVDTDVSLFDVVAQGEDWIQLHADSAQAFKKPVHWTAFGLVTDEHRENFVPFNSTEVADTLPPVESDLKRAQHTSSDKKQTTAYGSWGGKSVNSGINGVTHHQRSQNNLTPSDSSGRRSIQERQGYHRNAGSDTQGRSPDDGYKLTNEGAQGVLSATGRDQKAKSGGDSG